MLIKMCGVHSRTNNRCSIATVALCLLLSAQLCRHTAAAGADICVTCECTSEGGLIYPYLMLDCSQRQLTDILSEYPSHINSEPRVNIISITYDDNALRRLSALPATTVRIAFSGRRCAISQLAAGLFAAVPNLDRVDLGENDLTSDQLTADVFRGASMSELVLSANRIEHLPAGLFGHLTRLRDVDLSGNRLTQLTAVLAAMPLDLSSLDVSSNLLLRADDDTAAGPTPLPLPRLEDLNVWNNSFTHVPAVIRRLGGTLTALRVGGGCCLHNVSDIRDLPALRRLLIHSTDVAELQHIEGTAFGGLGHLQELRIGDNPHLHTLNITGLLSAAATLERLYLCGNALTSVQLNAAASTAAGNGTGLFGRLRMLRLKDNPWHCDCDLFRTLGRLVAGLSPREFRSEFTARCSSPPALASVRLVDVLLEPESTECAVSNVNEPLRWTATPTYEPPAIFRPRMLLLTMLSVSAVVALGLVIGFGIVHVQRRLRNNLSGGGGGGGGGGGVDAAGGRVQLRDTPVRYTTVRNSTTVPVGRQPSMRQSTAAWEPQLLQELELDQLRQQRPPRPQQEM